MANPNHLWSYIDWQVILPELAADICRPARKDTDMQLTLARQSFSVKYDPRSAESAAMPQIS